MEQTNNSSNSSSNPQNEHNYKNLNLTDYDCLIQAEYEFVTGTDKDVYNCDFSDEDIDMLKKIKHNKVNCLRFKKWYKMSYTQDQSKILSKIDYEEISKSVCKYSHINNSSINTSIFKKLSKKNSISSIAVPSQISSTSTYISNNTNCLVSQSELGLRHYYSKKKAHFKIRVMKGPPIPFRITAWMICANLPIYRPSHIYWDLLQNDIDIDIQNQINKDISRTMQGEEIIDNYGNNININGALFRILKSIAIVDVDLSYCQGMNFICGFLLRITNANEVDTFYILLALFSQTFNKKYGIRGFYMENFPLLKFYLYIFDLYFSKKLKKLYNKFTEIDMPQECWISKWVQTLFVHILPKESLLRVWDAVFSKGLKALVSISLSILSTLESQLLKVEDVTEISDIFKKNFNNGGVDIEKIILMANDKFYISKKEIQKYRMDYINAGNLFGNDIKYNYQNIEINKPDKIEDIVKKLNPCRKFKKKEKTVIVVDNNEDKDIDSDVSSVTESADGSENRKNLIHTVKSENIVLKNPFHH